MIEQPAADAMLDSTTFDAREALGPVRRRLVLRQVVRWAWAGAGLGAALGAVVLLGSHVRWIDGAPTIAFFLLLLTPICAAALSAARRPRLIEAARRADRHFGLDDRLTTALEFRAEHEPLVVLQRVETGRLVRDLPLAESAPAVATRRRVALTLSALVLFAAAMAAPFPSASPARAQPPAALLSPRARQAALAQLNTVSREITRGTSGSARHAAAVRRARAAIAHLRAQLRRAPDRATALRAISQTQQVLERTGSAIRPVNSASTRQVGRSLRQFMSPAEQRSINNGSHSNRATSQLLRRLADTAPQSPLSDRTRLARSLADAANRIPDARLRQTLRRAASALSNNDQRRAEQSLRKAASAISKSAANRQIKNNLSQSRKRLDSVKRAVSGLRSKAPPQSRHSNSSATDARVGRPTRLTASNARRKAGDTGQGAGRGAPQAGSGSGRSTNGADLRGQQGNVGGHSKKTRDASTTQAPGRYDTVFVPGKVSKGRYLSQNGPSGSPQHARAVSYRRVIARYSRTARAALERSDLPPSLRQYVRRYFTRLEQ